LLVFGATLLCEALASPGPDRSIEARSSRALLGAMMPAAGSKSWRDEDPDLEKT
jgi:hypothetical protein